MRGNSDVLRLYRALLRAQRRWPPQERREKRLSLVILDTVRTKFRAHASAPSADVPALLRQGQAELDALNEMLDNAVQSKFPLSPDSPMLNFRPSKQTFSLLDVEGQTAMDPKVTNSTNFFPSYVAGQFRRSLNALRSSPK